MIDREKVIRGLERCLKCSMIPTSSAEELKAYIDCEYTVGLYCGKDRLIFETLELLKEQEAVVRCKDCKHGGIDQSGIKGVWCPAHAEWHDNNWFCADGERK